MQKSLFRLLLYFADPRFAVAVVSLGWIVCPQVKLGLPLWARDEGVLGRADRGDPRNGLRFGGPYRRSKNCA
jgi:hypothetical protein